MLRIVRHLLVAVLLVSPALPGEGADSPPWQAASGALTGQLLVATPKMGDPRFDHAVIIIVSQNAAGALGIVINRQVSEQPLASVLATIGKPDATAKGTVRIFMGGPVEQQVGFILHSTDYLRPETQRITRQLAMTSSVQILRDLGHDRGPAQSLIAFGYAGWGSGQLEGEVKSGAWVTTSADPWLVFEAARDKVWDLAWARRTFSL